MERVYIDGVYAGVTWDETVPGTIWHWWTWAERRDGTSKRFDGEDEAEAWLRSQFAEREAA